MRDEDFDATPPRGNDVLSSKPGASAAAWAALEAEIARKRRETERIERQSRLARAAAMEHGAVLLGGTHHDAPPSRATGATEQERWFDELRVRLDLDIQARGEAHRAQLERAERMARIAAGDGVRRVSLGAFAVVLIVSAVALVALGTYAQREIQREIDAARAAPDGARLDRTPGGARDDVRQ